MDINTYQAKAIHFCGVKDEDRLLNGAVGLSGETGEVADLIKKYIYHGHDLDREALALELGDVMWYIVELSSAIGYDLNTIAEKNLQKLSKRYPEGFSKEASINRSDVATT